MNFDPSLLHIVENQFGEFLADEENKKIVFSGRFGSGKTTFINFFFGGQDSKFSSKYDCFHLFPVNYSVASNEDIFELIKYDILLGLLYKEIQIEESDVAPMIWVKKMDYLKIVSTILSMIPKVGKDLENILNGVLELKKLFEKHNDKYEVLFSGENELGDLLDRMEGRTGLLVENNEVTRIIERVLLRRKAQGKENVLVIDDLDRIDPEHIFRILNVFAAHMDERLWSKQSRSNKFGFDKVIVVCDISNVRKIFKSKYGQQVDFSGYIDKFYSKKIFYFNNRQLILKIISNKINNILIFPKVLDRDIEIPLRNFFPDKQYEILHEFLTELVLQDYVSLRKITSVDNRLNQSIFQEPMVKNRSINHGVSTELFLIDLIAYFSGGYDHLIEMMDEFSFHGLSPQSMNQLYSILVWMKLWDRHRFIAELNQSEFQLIEEDRFRVYFTLDNSGRTFHVVSIGSNQPRHFEVDSLRQLMKQMLVVVQKFSFLNN